MIPATIVRSDAERTLPRTADAVAKPDAKLAEQLEAAHNAALDGSLAVAGRTAARFLKLKP